MPQLPHTDHSFYTVAFGDGLFPLHSQLLRESQLISFPALNDMLKFSAWSYYADALIIIIIKRRRVIPYLIVASVYRAQLPINQET